MFVIELSVTSSAENRVVTVGDYNVACRTDVDGWTRVELNVSSKYK